MNTDSTIVYRHEYKYVLDSDNLYQHIMQDRVVLEVKFNQHLTGFIYDIISKYKLNQVAVSKYCNSRTLFT